MIIRPKILGVEIPAEEWENEALDLKKTPQRIANMLCDELLTSYRAGAYDELVDRFTCFPSDGQDSMVLESNIDFTSLCSHHALPFSGIAHVAYVPGSKLVGASKIPRVVAHYSHMLQLQERLGRQVADFIFKRAEAKIVIVMLEATHLCMTIRGIKQANAKMVTVAVRPGPGNTDDPILRPVMDEFYQQLLLTRK